ncbi:YhgE/Pip domain-containing protein [Atopobium sp. oral taxon 810]|uniref:YhgE/Pip domain-containing protein n=1 Tax=Atopobium sp. oral taxon 810 TaxID=712158 RepID=UPI0003980B75|nr:YhgE/Pip domain-containing protein [Atopobium sp. oral taxon 810]ERI04035.1 YhgE/Pip domain protein [Atopobium sp. oral taxon 810 str. F0209]
MKNPFRGLRFSLLDFHNARANAGMKVALAAICCIPLIYGALYLAAFYDPYGNIDKVPVVVVNQDKGTTTKDGKALNAGDDVVKQLRDAKALDFSYEKDADKAQRQLESGKYYMELIIPEDFSEKVSSAETDKPQQASFKLIGNQSANSIATTMGTSAFRVITSKVNYAIGQDYYVQIFDTIDDSTAEIKVAADGSAELSDGLASATDGSKKIADNLLVAGTGADELAAGIVRATDGSKQLKDGLSTAKDGAKSLDGGLGKLSDGASSVQDGADQLSDGISSAKDGADTLADKLTEAKKGSSTLATGASQLNAGASQLKKSLDGQKANIQALDNGVNELVGTVGQTGQKLSGVAAQLGSEGSSSGSTAYAAIKGVENSLAGAQKASPDGTVTLTAEQCQQLIGTLDAAASGVSQASSGLADAASGIDTNSLAQLKNGADALATNLTVSTGSTDPSSMTLYDAVTNLSAGANQVSSGATQLDQGVGQLADGASQLAGGLDSAKTGATALSAGASQLKTGTQSAKDGSSSLLGGIDKLYAGSASLSDGLGDAEKGSGSLADGIKKLADGATTLTKGISSAQDGADQLADGLSDGYKKAQESTANSDAKSEMMSEPVNLKSSNYTTVSNYGSGFAPYFIALGLWVGALMTTFIIKPLNQRLLASGANPIVAALAGLLPALMVGVIQAVLMGLVLQFGLKIDLLHPVAYYALCILTALCFAAWNQALVVGLGFPGKFLSVVLLMLQLTSAAGTFPLEVVPHFFKIINPLLPMTYSVRALRVATTGLDMSLITPNVWMLLAFTAVPFVVTCLIAARKRLVTMGDLHPLVQL